jgi:hypothetical protein
VKWFFRPIYNRLDGLIIVMATYLFIDVSILASFLTFVLGILASSAIQAMVVE